MHVHSETFYEYNLIYVCTYISAITCTYLIYFGAESDTDDSTDVPGNQMSNEECRSNEGLL